MFSYQTKKDEAACCCSASLMNMKSSLINMKSSHEHSEGIGGCECGCLHVSVCVCDIGRKSVERRRQKKLASVLRSDCPTCLLNWW